MKTMMQRVAVATVLCVSMAVLEGCGKRKSAEETEGGDRPVAIGAILPLTGAAAEFGGIYRQAAQHAVKEILPKMGVKAQLIVEDSKTSARDGINAWQRLHAIEPALPAVLTELSSVSMALAPLSEQADSLLIAVAATDALNNFSNVLRVYTSADSLAKAFHSAVNTLNVATDRVILYYLNDEYGRSVSDIIAKSATPLASAPREAFGSDIDTRTLVAKHPNATLCLVVGYGPIMGVLIRHIQMLNPAAVIICSPDFAFEDVMKSVNLQAETLYYLDFKGIDTTEIQMLGAKLGRRVTPLDILVIDSLVITGHAIIGLKTSGQPLFGLRLSQYIRGKTFHSLGRDISVDASGNMQYDLEVRRASVLAPR